MNILIDIGHPAHLHLFKNFAHKMIQDNHVILFTVRNKEFEIKLLKYEGFTFENIGKHYSSIIGKIWGLVEFSKRIFCISKKFKPDIFLSHGSIFNAIVSSVFKKPNISMENNGNWEQVSLYLPFTDVILSSTSLLRNYGKKHLVYRGYHELAYLHPNYFSPNINIYKELGIPEGSIYFILRFVSWNASHDIGQTGLCLDCKRQIIELLDSYGNVFISSENKLEPEFEKYRFPLNPQRMHHALAFASLFIGEGASMASECAILGTPAIYVNSIQREYLLEQQNYGLVYLITDCEKIIEKTQEILSTPNFADVWISRRQKMLADMIDVTSFLVWFIENYPSSKSTMKKRPSFQLRFK